MTRRQPRRHRVAVVVTAGAIALGGCGVSDANIEKAALRSEAKFVGVASTNGSPMTHERSGAMSRLGTELLASRPGENAILSPVSIMLNFAMLREGATGATAEQLDAVFGLDPEVPGESVAQLRATLAQFAGDVSTIDRDEPPAEPLVHVSDALFVAPDAGVTDAFLERIATFHDAGVFDADFRGKRAKALLDAWVNRETGGLIEKAPTEPDRDTKLTLLNAVVFAAQWQHQFDPYVTRLEPFTRADGTTVDVDTMHNLIGTRYVEGDAWQAVLLPYRSSSDLDFAMLLALPAPGAGPLTADQWDEVRAQANPALEQPDLQVALGLPRFEFDTTLDLRPGLEVLGLTAPFVPSGDLDGVFPDAFVTSSAHAATITLAEKGTVAAAVTQSDAAASGIPEIDVTLVLDRPFDFQIVSTWDMLPIFAGHVADPSG